MVRSSARRRCGTSTGRRTGNLTLVYNDPAAAEFEPRPVIARRRPSVLAEDLRARGSSYVGRLMCRSVRISREARVGERGKLVRVVEGMPIVSRHQTHTSRKGEAWKNHTGTLARVLGTVPLAADGSFFVEVPADRLIHLQVLDSDRRVVGNQQIWMYVRPGETRSCVGCHERPDTTPPSGTGRFPRAARTSPVKCLPTGGEFTYRAKFWNKGTLTDEGEERTRTVRAVNLLGRQ
ncbi:MAG: HzsA-related protein [Planctomycetota bacterium]